ncbi:uncharacterized protein GBIM_00051 [Gryllus bimaculatus]|nr:uncharacterized protein GBIM_00051 [Gryllus bimaculatus]
MGLPHECLSGLPGEGGARDRARHPGDDATEANGHPRTQIGKKKECRERETSSAGASRCPPVCKGSCERPQKDNLPEDDEKEFHILKSPNATYEVVSTLGKGVYGKVMKCRHVGSKQLVAVKVFKPTPIFKEAGKREVQFLARLRALRCEHVVRCVEWFEERATGRACIVLELLCSVSTAEKRWEAARRGQYAQTRHFRAPEVLLRAGLRAPADMWSLGCSPEELWEQTGERPQLNGRDVLLRSLDELATQLRAPRTPKSRRCAAPRRPRAPRRPLPTPPAPPTPDTPTAPGDTRDRPPQSVLPDVGRSLQALTACDRPPLRESALCAYESSFS